MADKHRLATLGKEISELLIGKEAADLVAHGEVEPTPRPRLRDGLVRPSKICNNKGRSVMLRPLSAKEKTYNREAHVGRTI